jgi:hypothetical protein
MPAKGKKTAQKESILISAFLAAKGIVSITAFFF